MTIEDLYINGDISMRAYHSCIYNEICSILDLIKYYNKHKSFKKLKNCGEKTNQELINIYNFHQNINISKGTEININIVADTVKLNNLQKHIINQFIKINTKNLLIKNINFSINEFNIPTDRNILNNDLNISKIEGLNENDIPEIKNLLKKIKKFTATVSSIKSDKELRILNNNIYIQEIYSSDNSFKNILASQSIIKICDFIIKENVIFKEKHSAICKKTINIYNSNYKSIEEVRKNYNLTRERIRQIRQECFINISNKLLFLKYFNDDIFQHYEIDNNENIIFVSNEKAKKINYNYNTNFSKSFITFLLSIYLSGKFSLIGNIEDVLLFKNNSIKNRYFWKNIYLIKDEINNEININRLCYDINTRLREKITQTYMFNFKSYLYKFITDDNFKIINLVKDSCEIIINEEFNMYLDLDENIVFKRNTVKTADEYTYEALEMLGKPSKVIDIYLKVKELFPYFETDKDKVRASLKRRNGFVPVGRKSVFGLKKWEDELDNFKGGTIRSIVREYLDNSDIPKHINEISDYVIQFRPKTNRYSVLQNLKLDKSKIFMFFNNSHIGLSNKKYSSEYVVSNSKLITKKRSWEESYEVLKKFIIENDRLPYSSNCPESEEILYRWLSVQNSKINQKKLNQEKTELINKILKQFPNRIIRRHSNNKINFSDLLKFTSKKNRLPKPTIKEEKSLYYYFYRKRNLDKKGELNEEESALMSNLVKQYINKNSHLNKYNILLDFVRKNKRLPSASFKEEQSLYQFFYLQRKLYEKDELDNNLKKYFLLITNEIQNI